MAPTDRIGLVDTREFRTTTALEHHRKNIQLGLRIGQAALIEFTVEGKDMKAVWILMNNKLSTTKGGSDPTTRNPFWKFVAPIVSYFAWLPAGIAHSFCAEATKIPNPTNQDGSQTPIFSHGKVKQTKICLLPFSNS